MQSEEQLLLPKGAGPEKSKVESKVTVPHTTERPHCRHLPQLRFVLLKYTFKFHTVNTILSPGIFHLTSSRKHFPMSLTLCINVSMPP